MYLNRNEEIMNWDGDKQIMDYSRELKDILKRITIRSIRLIGLCKCQKIYHYKVGVVTEERIE